MSPVFPANTRNRQNHNSVKSPQFSIKIVKPVGPRALGDITPRYLIFKCTQEYGHMLNSDCSQQCLKFFKIQKLTFMR